MKVHPPREIDSWREFFVEILIIVIGVALALAAEEALSQYHTNQEVAVVQNSLDEELTDSLFASRERLRFAACEKRMLDRLDSVAHGASGALPPDSFAPPLRLWGSAAWDAAVASGIVEEMDHDERHAYAVLFSIVRSMKDWNTRERELWAVIRAYQRTPPATPEARHRLAEAVSQLQSLSTAMNAASRQFVGAAQPLGLQLPPADSASLGEPVSCPVA